MLKKFETTLFYYQLFLFFRGLLEDKNVDLVIFDANYLYFTQYLRLKQKSKRELIIKSLFYKKKNIFFLFYYSQGKTQKVTSQFMDLIIFLGTYGIVLEKPLHFNKWPLLVK